MFRLFLLSCFLPTIVVGEGCSVCGVGKKVTNTEAIFTFPGQPSVPCGLLESSGQAGLIPLDQCGFLPALLGVCECGADAVPAAPISLAPVTPAPVTPAPVTPAPVSPAPVIVAPLDPTDAPLDPTDDPLDPTAAPLDPTAAPVDPTAAPVDPTPAPVDPTPAPVNPTPAPVDPTAAPVDPTAAPVDPTAAPASLAPVERASDASMYKQTAAVFITLVVSYFGL